jgi:hypothetical protein
MTPTQSFSAEDVAAMRLTSLFRDQVKRSSVEDSGLERHCAIDPVFLHGAGLFVARYGSTQHIVEVSPTQDGYISIVWDDYKGNYAYLGFGPKETIHLFYHLSNGEKWEEISIVSDIIISTQLVKALKFSRH